MSYSNRILLYTLIICTFCTACSTKKAKQTYQNTRFEQTDQLIPWGKIETYYDLESALRDTVSLKCIRLDSIKSLPRELLRVKNLIVLDISYNEMDSLPEWIGELNDLMSIDLRANKLKHLPASFFNLKKLQTIDLWGNELRSVSSDFNKLNSLKKLNLSSNFISSLPDLKLDSLYFLLLEHNNLKTIPVELCHLYSLERLHLYNNKISDFSKSIRDMISLKELNLDYNQLSEEKLMELNKALPNCIINPGEQYRSIK